MKTTDDPAAMPPRLPACGLFELQLVTHDHGAMVHFYRDVVGLEARIVDDERGRMHLHLADDGSQLILVQADGDDVVPHWVGLPPQLFDDHDTVERGPAAVEPMHFAVHVAAAAQIAATERIEASGASVRGPLEWGDGLVSRYALDPDGNCVELIGR